MKKILALFIIMILSFTSCTTIKTNDKKVQKVKTVEYTLEQKKKVEDVKYFCSRLDQNHGNLYKNISKAAFDNAEQKLIDEIPHLSDFEFYIELNHLLSLIHDNNASAQMSYNMDQDMHIIPLSFRKFDDGYYVIAAKDKQYLGCKVKAINGVEMDKAAIKFKYFINYENKQSFALNAVSMMNYTELLKYFKIIDDESEVKVTIEKDEKTQEITFKPLTVKEMQSSMTYINPKLSEYKKVDEHSYSTKIIDDDNYYISYSRCIEDSSLSVSNLIKDIKKDCKENNFKNIIVDLRLNGFLGNDKVGDNTLFIPVIQCLQDLSKHGKKIYGLIGENTCGPVMTNCVQLKKYASCTFVGQPTYGNVNEFVNEHGVIVLPNSRIYLLYSNKYIENDKNGKNDSLYPDIEIKHNFKDFIEGKDREMEWILGKS